MATSDNDTANGGATPSDHEKARELTEKALDKLVEGHEDEASSLIDAAKKLDPSGPEEVLRELEEDAETRGEAAGDHD